MGLDILILPAICLITYAIVAFSSKNIESIILFGWILVFLFVTKIFFHRVFLGLFFTGLCFTFTS